VPALVPPIVPIPRRPSPRRPLTAWSAWPAWVAALAATMLLSACLPGDRGLLGSWAVDLERTLAQARTIGASERELRDVRDTYADGRLHIGADRLTIRIAGLDGQEVLPYQEVGQDGPCHLLRIAATQPVHRYCREDDRLLVHDPSTRLVVVYRKA